MPRRFILFTARRSLIYLSPRRLSRSRSKSKSKSKSRKDGMRDEKCARDVESWRKLLPVVQQLKFRTTVNNRCSSVNCRTFCWERGASKGFGCSHSDCASYLEKRGEGGGEERGRRIARFCGSFDVIFPRGINLTVNRKEGREPRNLFELS